MLVQNNLPSDPAAMGHAWIASWSKRARRPLRVLHIGNIANNAYNNARIQRQFGIDADVLSYDFYHIMGTPEWEDADFAGDPGDPFFPDWSLVDLKGFERPRWFAAGPLKVAARYLYALHESHPATEQLWRAMVRERHMRASKALTMQARVIVRKVPAKLRYEWKKLKTRFKSESYFIGPDARSFASLHAILGKQDAPCPRELQPDDLERYYEKLPDIQDLMTRYDIIQGYSTDGVWPLLAGHRYAAYEHGTLRELPFEASSNGSIASLVFGAADQIFVTNVDCLASAERMGLAEDRVTALPHAFDEQRLVTFRQNHIAISPPSNLIKFFAPARHDWKQSDPSLSKGNDRMLYAASRLVADGLAFELVLVRWGRDVAASERLIDELGLGRVVRWIEPVRKRLLWREYLETHAVLDQFLLPAFGGVTFEALALGRRVITSLDVKAAERFFGEAPPLFAASTPDEIEAAMRAVMADAADRRGHGDAAAAWVVRYHSARRIVGLQLAAYQKILENA